MPLSLKNMLLILMPRVRNSTTHLTLAYVPEALLETVNSVVTPRVVLPATESTSIQKETQDMTTISMVGK